VRDRRYISAVLSLLLLGSVFAADLKLPTKVKGEVGDYIEVSATTDGKEVRWYAIDPDLKLFPTRLLKDTKTAVVSSRKAGTYRLLAYTADDKGPSEPSVCEVQVGDAPPIPPTPTPTPPPIPPAPDPSSSPIPLPGFRVLIIFESEETYPAPLESVIYGNKIRNYLKAKCVDEAGGIKGFWILDKDVDVSALPKHWQDAWARSLTKIAAWKPTKNSEGKPVGATSAIPWILISNGTTGFEGPLPTTVDEALALLKKYGESSGRGK
jgi:hypothetical protein